MSDKSRRKLLKSIAAGSGAVIAGKSLPDSWSRPVVDSVMLPAHAQTSQPQAFSQTITQNTTLITPTPLNFDFDVTGLTPTGAGLITVTAFADLGLFVGGADPTEFITVHAERNRGSIRVVYASRVQCDVHGSSGPESMPISLAQLQAAIAGNTITIQLAPSDQVNGVCGGPGDQIVKLEFPL